MNEKTSENQILPQESHEKNKNKNCPSCKIHITILKIDKGGTLRNWA